MATNEYQAGDTAPGSGGYEELNVFGSPTGRIAVVAEGEKLPDTARHFTWRPLGEHSAAELRQRAVGYRRMADAARTAQTMGSLRRLAERFDALAEQREREG